ncbi:MAG: DUF2975 domain-containing protein [Ignavibacteriales bacterium]|nr:DUF2975 domain-containing protein [Ignavibacteriales bacterium]
MKSKFISNFRVSSSYSALSIFLGAAGLLTILSIVLPLLFWLGGQSMPTWFAVMVRLELPASEVKRIAATNYSVFPIWGELTIFHTSRLNEIMSALIPILAFGSTTYGVYLLRKLLKNIYDENYFAKENKRIMYMLGTLCIIIPYVIKLIQYAVIASLPKELVVDGMKVIPSHLKGSSGGIINPYFFAGMLLIILADVFSEGRKLKEENDLTV